MANSPNVLDEILSMPNTEPDVAPSAPQPPPAPLAPGVGGGPTGRGDTIKVQVEGVPAPLEFEPGTSPEVIQSVVKRVTSQQPQPPSGGNLPHVPEGMGAAGAAGGATFGMSVGGPPGAAIGAMAGGTGGHMLGQTVQDLSNGVEQNLDRIAENALESTKYGLGNGILEGAGQFLRPVIDPVIYGIKWAGSKIGEKLFVPKEISETARKAEELLREIGAPGLTSGQLSEPGSKRLGTISENLAYNSMTTNIVNKIRNRQWQGLKDYVANLMEQWGQLPAKDATELFKWAVNDNFEGLVRQPMNVAMKDLREALPGNIVNATPLLRKLQSPNAKVTDVVRTILEKEHEQDPAVYDKLIKLLAPTKPGAGTRALPNLSLDEAMRLNAALGTLERKYSKMADGPSRTMAVAAGTYSKQLDAAIKQSLSGTPELLRSYESSMAAYAEGMQTFKNEMVQKFMAKLNTEPGELANLVLQPGQVEFVKNLKNIAGDTMWKQVVEPRLGATVLYKAFGPPSKSGGLSIEGALSGTKLATTLQHLASDGTAQAIFPQTYTKLLDLAKTIEHIKPTPKGTGGVFIQLAQAGAVGAVVGAAGGFMQGGDTKSSLIGAGIGMPVFVLLGPRMLGRLVAEPKYIDAFKHGLIETQRTGKPTTGLLDVIKHLGAQEGVKGLLTEPAAPSSDPTLNQRPNIFKRPQSSTASVKPSGLTSE